VPARVVSAAHDMGIEDVAAMTANERESAHESDVYTDQDENVLATANTESGMHY